MSWENAERALQQAKTSETVLQVLSTVPGSSGSFRAVVKDVIANDSSFWVRLWKLPSEGSSADKEVIFELVGSKFDLTEPSKSLSRLFRLSVLTPSKDRVIFSEPPESRTKAAPH